MKGAKSGGNKRKNSENKFSVKKLPPVVQKRNLVSNKPKTPINAFSKMETYTPNKSVTAEKAPYFQKKPAVRLMMRIRSPHFPPEKAPYVQEKAAEPLMFGIPPSSQGKCPIQASTEHKPIATGGWRMRHSPKGVRFPPPFPPMPNLANMNRLKDPVIKPLATPVVEEKDSDSNPDSDSNSHSNLNPHSDSNLYSDSDYGEPCNYIPKERPFDFDVDSKEKAPYVRKEPAMKEYLKTRSPAHFPPMPNLANMNRLKDRVIKPSAGPADEEKDPDSDFEQPKSSRPTVGFRSLPRRPSTIELDTEHYDDISEERPFDVDHKIQGQAPHLDVQAYLQMGDTLACNVLALFNLDTWEERRAMMVNNFDDLAGLALQMRKKRMSTVGP